MQRGKGVLRGVGQSWVGLGGWLGVWLHNSIVYKFGVGRPSLFHYPSFLGGLSQLKQIVSY